MNIETYTQKIDGKVRETLTVNHSSGVAVRTTYDHRGAVIGTSTYGAGAGEVTQFIAQAERA
jgi:hypothetical protein